MTSALIASLHFIGAFTVVATVFAEWLMFSRSPTLAEARRIQACDIAYGIAAGVVLLAGGLRMFYFEKGSQFYLSNPVFHAKLALFLVVGLMSIYPTIQFIRWRQQTRTGQAPQMTDSQFNLIRTLLAWEMILLVGMVVSASLMAKGIGLN
jgi:putative membrane protein